MLSGDLANSAESSSISSLSLTFDEPDLDFPVPLTFDLPPLFGSLPFAEEVFIVSFLNFEVVGVSCFLAEVFSMLELSSLDLPDFGVALSSFLDLLASFEAASTNLPPTLPVESLLFPTLSFSALLLALEPLLDLLSDLSSSLDFRLDFVAAAFDLLDEPLKPIKYFTFRNYRSE